MKVRLSKYLFLCSTDKYKLIQVWNNISVSNWRKFHFWVNDPFKIYIVGTWKCTPEQKWAPQDCQRFVFILANTKTLQCCPVCLLTLELIHCFAVVSAWMMIYTPAGVDSASKTELHNWVFHHWWTRGQAIAHPYIRVNSQSGTKMFYWYVATSQEIPS